MTKPRLLFLCQTLPFPPDGGVAIRSFNILRLLSRRYEVAALTFYRRATATDVRSSKEALREFTSSIETFPIEHEYSIARLARDHLESTIAQRVYTTRAYRSGAFRQHLRGMLLRQRYDLVHLDSLDLSVYLPLVEALPTICTHHNIESQLLRRRAEVAGSRSRASYLRMQAHLMEREEQRWCPALSLNVTVSPEDKRTLGELAPNSRITVIPNGVDIQAFIPLKTHDSGIVFVGGMTWFPNKDALEYFARDILPALRQAGYQDEVTWVGRKIEGADAEFAPQGITLTGFVDDIRPYVAQASCYIVPLRVGGGTRLKILDAWAMGKAIVSTSVGCEGLAARDGWNILIRDDPLEFAAAVLQVLSDAGLRDRLGANARTTAERTYSWDVIGERLYAEYESVRLRERHHTH